MLLCNSNVLVTHGRKHAENIIIMDDRTEQFSVGAGYRTDPKYFIS